LHEGKKIAEDEKPHLLESKFLTKRVVVKAEQSEPKGKP
jgi:hypothetical protein